VDVKQVRGKIESDMDPFSLDLIRKGMIILKDRRDIESHNSFFDERDINQAKDVTMVKLGRGFVT
jgi:hypothetical protein